MPVFPTPPSITSRIAQGTPLTFEEADANFGNLTASLDETIQVIQVAAYTDQNNTFDASTTQSFGKVTATETVVTSFTSSNAVFNGTVQFNNTVTFPAGDLTANITGSVFGTASWAENALVATTASFVVTASNANTASWANNAIYADTASYVSLAKSASFVQTASYVHTAQSASYIPTLQQVTAGGNTTTNPVAFYNDVTIDNTSSNPLTLGDIDTTNYYVKSAGQLFIITNRDDSASNTGLILQSGEGNTKDAQIFINGNAASGTPVSKVEIKTTVGGTLTTYLKVEDGSVYLPNLPTSATGLPVGALYVDSGFIKMA